MDDTCVSAKGERVLFISYATNDDNEADVLIDNDIDIDGDCYDAYWETLKAHTLIPNVTYTNDTYTCACMLRFGTLFVCIFLSAHYCVSCVYGE